MLNESTYETLRQMKFSAMANEFRRQLEDPETYKSLDFDERFGMLVDAEWNRRQTNKINRLMKEAGFAIPSACIEDIEYFEDRKLDKQQILRFATCAYIDEGHHIILKGASGNGKTYISNALGNAACRKLKTVKYVRLPELLDEINVAKGCGELKKLLRSYRKKDLLIFDEWLIRPLTLQEAYDLLEIIEVRSYGGSVIFCTQYEPDDWYERMGSNRADPEQGSAITDAIMDRIRHNSYEVMIDGRVSMRERYGINSKEKGGDQA